MDDIDFLVLDFDSTIVQGETLEVLAEIALSNHSERERIVAELGELTAKAMDGSIDFAVALERRIALFQADKTHLKTAIAKLKGWITPSFLEYRQVLAQFSQYIYVVSGGFYEVIVPVVELLGLAKERVYANTFVYSHDGRIVGVDLSNPLSQSDGKRRIIERLELKGKGIVLGDGISDFEAANGLSHVTFCAFTENVHRAGIVSRAEKVLANGRELFASLAKGAKLPKTRRALLLEGVHAGAGEMLEQAGFVVEQLATSLDASALSKRLDGVNFLGIRSKTRISADLLKKAAELECIGCFCIGTEQVDHKVAGSLGIPVFNAPFANTRSVVELAMACIIMLSRRAADKSAKMHAGKWDKSLAGASEVRGKVLGIVGYGKIGSQLSVIAEFMGMEVIYHDLEDKLPIGNAKAIAKLSTLLRRADVVSLHVDGRRENHRLIDAKALAMLQAHALLINYSRGCVVDISALASALKSKAIAGAAVDVFPEEPDSRQASFISELQNLPNTILTPHIGGNTIEAQESIGRFVATRAFDFIKQGSTQQAVNFPRLQIPKLSRGTRILHVHQNIPGILARINGTLSQAAINVERQFLATCEEVGYVVTDVESCPSPIMKELAKIPHTIKAWTIDSH